MFIQSEIIVGLWFLPVVLFILIPLSMLCVRTFIQPLRKVAKKTKKGAEGETYTAGLHSSSVA